MGKDKKKDNKPVSLKKATYNQLTTQLGTTIAWLKDLLGEKKYNNRIEKAARLLSDGIRKKPEKKAKPGKKKTVKNVDKSTDTIPVS